MSWMKASSSILLLRRSITIWWSKLYIPFNKPVRTRKGLLYLHQGCLTAPVGPEPMRFITEHGFIDAFQNHLNDFLHKLVIARLDTQRTFLITVLLCNIYSLCRFGTVAALIRSSLIPSIVVPSAPAVMLPLLAYMFLYASQ